MAFNVGDKVRYFYAFPEDDCEVVAIEGAEYRVRRKCADGSAHEFIIDGDQLKLIEDKQLDFGFADTTDTTCDHIWREVTGIRRSLGWSCVSCDMRKEDWEQSQRLKETEKAEKERSHNSREWTFE